MQVAVLRQMIRIKSKREIEIMAQAGRLLAEVHDALEEHIKPGVSTYELDRIAEDLIRQKGAEPGFKGYQGYPATLCVSINNEVVHGIPSKKRKLQEGDIVSIDMGLIFGGYYSDAARTHCVGNVSRKALLLCKATEEALMLAIKQCVVGNRLGDVGFAVEQHAKKYGFSVVRDYVGHGIGRELHELPSVPNYGPPGTRMLLVEGLVLAIEPMINAGGSAVKVLNDGWTVVTKDGSLSAHFEHTVAITADGPRILTESIVHPGRMTFIDFNNVNP